MRSMYAKTINKELMIFLLIFLITFTVYSFSSHGHRNTPDEYLAFVQAKQIATLTPAKDYIPEETRLNLQLGGHMSITKCENGILCSYSPIGHSISYVPFILVENTFHMIPNFLFTQSDFDDPHYVWWRNSLGHDEIFTFLFFGPIVSSLSVSMVFKIARTYNYSHKISVLLSLLYGFTTIAWAYSTTGFSSIEEVLLILVGFFFFRKYEKTNNVSNLIFMSIFLGFSFLVRNDTIIFIIVLLIFFTINQIKKKNRIKNFVGFFSPLIISGGLQLVIERLRFGTGSQFVTSASGLVGQGFHSYPLQMGLFGMLFSPGAGIFIFSPILFTMFVSFLDFYKRNKFDLFLILGYFLSLLFFYASSPGWHGFVSWSARYMLPIIPFLLLPLGSTIEKRKNNTLSISLIVLGVIGVFFSFAWIVQDVNWYVWGQMGESKGLYGLGGDKENIGLRLNSAVFWTFQYSQLNQAINLAFTHLQPDLFLLKILGPAFSILLVVFIIIPSSILLSYLVKKNDKNTISNEKESNTSF